MRYIIYGAGAVGGVIGSCLFQAGHEVVLIARGPHLDAIKAKGLRFRDVEQEAILPISAVGHPGDIGFRPDDVVILTMKSQDTDRALAELETAGGRACPIICAQNGVENERLAARCFERVYGMCVYIGASYLEPGVVVSRYVPVSATLHTGCYPSGVDDFIAQVAADISTSRMESRPTPRVMDLKYAKLIVNIVSNGLQVLLGDRRDGDAYRRLTQRVRSEATTCFEAAGIAYTTPEEFRGQARLAPAPDGGPREPLRTSTLQDMLRGKTTTEVDYLNGEIVLLGRLHGIPTPANRLVRQLVTQVASSGEGVGAYSAEDLEAMLEHPA
ncbi:MAG: 2-dehydropantoate 2-reductase [Chloroflexi bacterium]|nr:2-dehydropantoate 2-reductase [Chloroflexota bacterium]